MRRIKIVGLCLLATLALGAVFAVSAQAEEKPGEVGQCVKIEKTGKVYKGSYLNKECTDHANLEEESLGGKKNKYNWRAGAGHKGEYSEKGKTEILIRGGAGFEVKCTASVGRGKFKSATLGEFEVTFTGCKSTHKESENACKSKGAAAGEVNMALWNTEFIGHGRKAKGGKEPLAGEAWVQYTSHKEEGAAPLASFECEGIPIEISGALSASNTLDINTMSKKATNTVSNALGEQHMKAKYYDSFTKETVETTANIEGELPIKYEEKYEVRA